MTFNDCKIATTIANNKPPITGAGIHKRLNIETLFTIPSPNKSKTHAIAKL